LVIAVARLVVYKQVDHLLRAFSILKMAMPQARLEMLGDGPAASSLKELAVELGLENAVTWRGHVPDAQTELARAGVFAMTSEYEGQSLVILEALAHGTPVVSYDVNYGPAEMVVPGVNGELVTAGDIDGLARAILSILGDTSRMHALSDGAWAWAQSHGVDRAMSALSDACEFALGYHYG
jgi:poly(glycerol-phosphate) alpha-glucosyltransferase